MITLAAWVLAGLALWLTRGVLDMFGDAHRSTRVAMLPSLPELAGLIVLALVFGGGVAVVVRRWTASSAERAKARRQIALPLFGLTILALPYLPWLPDWILPLRALAGPIAAVLWFVVIGQMTMAILSLRAVHRGTTRVIPTVPTIGSVAIFVATLAVAGTAAWHLRDSLVYSSGDELRYVSTMALLTAIAATLMWRWAFAYTGSAEAATIAWTTVFLGAPLLFNSFAVSPEIPAALCVMLVLGCPSKRGTAPFLVPISEKGAVPLFEAIIRGLAVAALPWLAMTYAPMAAALTGILCLRAGANRKAIIVVLSLVTISLALWLGFFQILRGRVPPLTPFGSQLQFGNPVVGGLGLLFDQEYGVLAYAPALALGIIGIWRMARSHDPLTRHAGLEMAVVFSVLFLSVAALDTWWGGPAPPGRPLVPVLPVLGLPIAWVYRSADSPVRRAAYQTIVFIGIAVSSAMLFFEHGALIAQHGDGSSRLLQRFTVLWPAWEAAPSIVAFGWRYSTPMILIWIGGAAVVARLCRRDSSTRAAGTAGLLATCYVSAGLMAVALVAPLLVRPPFEWTLQPESRARVPILDNFDAVARPHAVIYDPFTLVRASSIPPLMTLAAVPGQYPGGQPVQVLLNARYALPAGEYEVQISGVKNTQPVRGYIALQVGRIGSPMREWEVDLAPGAVWRSTFKLAVDAEFVGFIAEPPLDTATSLRIRPLRIADKSRRQAIFHGGEPRTVLSAIEFPSTSVFFHDNVAYPERAGIWIRGRSTASMTVAPERPENGVVLRVHSGTRPNTLTFVTTTWGKRIQLSPGRPQEVHIPAPPQPGPFVLSVTADSGFVPAEVIPGNTDTRLLGGWMEFAN